MTDGLDVAAIVPCAGRSSRMGRPKALLDADGEPFLGRVVRTLVAGGASPVVVVVRDAGGPEAAVASRAGALVVVNPEPDDPERGGPISSIRAGLGALPPAAGAVLVHPVDHPRVRPETVEALIETYRASPLAGGPLMVTPTRGGRSGHPVLFSRELFGELREADLGEGARTVLRRHADERVSVPVDDPGVVDDLDTPSAYERVFGEGGR